MFCVIAGSDVEHLTYHCSHDAEPCEISILGKFTCLDTTKSPYLLFPLNVESSDTTVVHPLYFQTDL